MSDRRHAPCIPTIAPLILFISLSGCANSLDFVDRIFPSTVPELNTPYSKCMQKADRYLTKPNYNQVSRDCYLVHIKPEQDVREAELSRQFKERLSKMRPEDIDIEGMQARDNYNTEVESINRESRLRREGFYD